MRILLTRYWFKFKSNTVSELPPNLLFGCGITAYNEKDALYILGLRVFKGLKIPEIVTMEEDVDIGGLDPRHVIPNMKNYTLRGVWFPPEYG